MPRFDLSVVPRKALESNMRNWFRFVPSVPLYDGLVDDLRCNPLVRPLKDVIGTKKMIRGTEMGKIVHFARQRDSRIREKWMISKEDAQHVTARHSNKTDEISAPKSALVPSIRTHSGVRTICVDPCLDYLVVGRFPGDDILWEEWPRHDPGKRSKEFLRRKCHLTLVRRPDLSSPGVSLLSFCSSSEIIPSKMLWCLKDIDDESSKILSIWFNSTISFLAMLEERAETRGSFSGWDKEHWEEVLMLNPAKLTADQKDRLIELYESVKDVRFPSFIDQFRTRFEPRRIIDMAILDALSMKDYSTKEELNRLYDSIFEELGRLKKIVHEG